MTPYAEDGARVSALEQGKGGKQVLDGPVNGSLDGGFILQRTGEQADDVQAVLNDLGPSG